MTRFAITEIKRFDGTILRLEIYGEKIVWASKNNREEQILIYDGNEIIEIEKSNGSFPQISGLIRNPIIQDLV